MKILITEDQLRWLIYEGRDSVLYHYGSKESLVNILQTNKIRASLVDWSEKYFSKGRMFFLSTTRVKEFVFLGYDCRIYLDYSKIKQKYKVIPINFFGEKKSTEHEERILMNEAYLVASDYITRIDVFAAKYRKYNSEIYRLATNLNIPIYFFEYKRDYVKGDEKKAEKEITLQTPDYPENVKGNILEDNLISFLSIFYITNKNLHWLKFINKKVLYDRLLLFYKNNSVYRKNFKRIISLMYENDKYWAFLTLLAKTMRKVGASDVDKFLDIQYWKLYKMMEEGDLDYILIEEQEEKLNIYISNGSTGNLNLRGCSLTNLGELQEIEKTLEISSSKLLIDFGKLKTVGVDLIASNCPLLKTFSFLERVDRNLDASNCPELNDLGELEEVGKDFYLGDCISLTNLGKLKRVGDLIHLRGCTSLISLDNLESAKYVDVRDCTSLKNLGKLDNVEKSIYIKNTPLESQFKSGELGEKYPKLRYKFVI
jgi:hypothetical protein